MLKTLIVCLAGCGTPTSISDELGKISAGYLRTCHELQELRRAFCPEWPAPPLLQCVNDVERELPARYRGEFRQGVGVLAQRFASELPSAVAARFAAEVRAAGGEAGPACAAMAADIDHQRLQLRSQLRSFSKAK